jgi:hypothetical protein
LFAYLVNLQAGRPWGAGEGWAAPVLRVSDGDVSGASLADVAPHAPPPEPDA